MKPKIKIEIFSILLLVISWAAAFYFYAHFPDRVVTHWNYAGVPNGWSGKAFGAFFLPPLLTVMYLMFLVLPLLDPKKERYAEFAKTYSIFRFFILLAMTVIYFVASLNNLGYNFDVGIFVTGAIGLLFIVLGNYFGKIKPNWFVGIRTPWTLSSETVWNKTHRFGGKVFILGGILLFLSSVAPTSWRLPIFIVDIMMLTLGTIVYSYIVYRQEKK